MEHDVWIICELFVNVFRICSYRVARYYDTPKPARNFRAEVNLGPSLTWKTTIEDSDLGHTDAVKAAAGLYEILRNGTYLCARSGKRIKINGDSSKLPYATNVTALQRKLIADLNFRCKKLAGTTAATKKLYNVIRFAGLFYGHPTFVTVTPTERHGVLALRLSRYRACDPYMQASDTEAAWAGPNEPSCFHFDFEFLCENLQSV